MNPNSIRQPQDRRKVYNEYLANLQMQINNLAKTEQAVTTLGTTGAPPVQPTDTRTVSEKLLDVANQKKVLRQSLLELTDGAEAGKIMKTISDEDVLFLGIAWADFSELIKRKFSNGILAPIFNEVLQRYKKDYITSLSTQQSGSTDELLLSMRELMRLMPSGAQLKELTYTIQQLPVGSVPSGMMSSALSATSNLSQLMPTSAVIEALDKMNPIDRAAAEKAFNDGLSSITTGALLQDLTQKLQQASPKQIPSILTTIIKDILLTTHDKEQLVQAKAIAEQKTAMYETKTAEEKSITERKKSSVLSSIKGKQSREEEFATMLESPIVENPTKTLTAQRESYDRLIEDPATDPDTLDKLTLTTLRQWVGYKIASGELPKMKAVSKMSKIEILKIVEDFKGGKFMTLPPPKARKVRVSKTKASASPFVVVEYDPDMSVAEFEARDYPDKRSIIEDMVKRGIIQDELSVVEYNDFKEIMDRNKTSDEPTLNGIYEDIRRRLGLGGKGLKQSSRKVIPPERERWTKSNIPKGGISKRITFGGSIASMKPIMSVRPDNIDSERGIKREASYLPIGKYVIHKQKLRDNTLLMRTMKGGQIAELPQMSISPKLGKMLNKIISGHGFPSHGDLTEMDESDQDILYKVFKMSKAQGIDALPKPNKTKDEAEFNRFTILKGQILAGNNSKELIKEFKTLLVKLIHNDKILRKDGHNLLMDFAALGY